MDKEQLLHGCDRSPPIANPFKCGEKEIASRAPPKRKEKEKAAVRSLGE